MEAWLIEWHRPPSAAVFLGFAGASQGSRAERREADPRVAMGYAVEDGIVGPFGVMPAKRDGSGGDGGTLDVGITAYTPDGTRVCIGEIWAACPSSAPGGKTRLNAVAVAEQIVRALNAARPVPHDSPEGGR